MAGGSGFQPRFTRAIAVTPLEKQRDASKNRSHNQKQQIQNYKVSFPIRLDAGGQRRRLYETSYEITPNRSSESSRRTKSPERRTSNAQHRTLNVDDATLYRFYNKRTAEIRSVDSLPAFVATSAEQAYAVVFIKLTEYIIRRWTFNVRCSTFIFLLIPYMKLH